MGRRDDGRGRRRKIEEGEIEGRGETERSERTKRKRTESRTSKMKE